MSDETFMMGARPAPPPAPAFVPPAPVFVPPAPAPVPAPAPAPRTGSAGTARRTVLAGVGIVAAGTLGYAVAVGGQLARPDKAAAQGAGTGSGAAADQPKPAGQGAGAQPALVAVADVPAGGGTVVKDAKVVVTKDQSGQVRAFSAICTHQGCTVASVSGGTINCPCHGSK